MRYALVLVVLLITGCANSGARPAPQADCEDYDPTCRSFRRGEEIPPWYW
jgi:hypothetical protein